ncbi:phage tail tube protein [Xanthomonas translucens]|uniref:phage tail tube protein n=1 Tax=Xanthomonas campestris pv. translucens TaxID=343 RepID=UPI00071E9B6B|nr:phage tail tube protein [Xanthomonas translucens]
MALTLPKGIQFGFAPLVPTVSRPATALSNAKPTAATWATGSTVIPDGTPVLLKASGWPLANNKVAVVSGNLLLGVDTTDPQLFPVAKAGTVSAVTTGAFTDFTQQGEPTSSGGEQQFWTGMMLEDPLGRQISLPTFKNAKTLTIPLYFDPSEAWYDKAKTTDAKGEPVVLRAKMPNGDALYWYGYLSFDADPTIAANTPMGNTATFTIIGESTLVRAQ